MVAQHPKLNIKNAVQTLDILAKTYLYDDVFGPYSFRPFALLAERFREDPAFVSFILKLAKVLSPCDSRQFALQIYTGNVKKADRAKGAKPARHLLQASLRNEEQKLLADAQDQRVLGLLQRALELGNEEIVQKMPPILIEANLGIKAISKADDPRLMDMLSKLGNVAELLKDYERQHASASGLNSVSALKPASVKTYMGSPHRRNKCSGLEDFL